jgi:hypothetical protein
MRVFGNSRESFVPCREWQWRGFAVAMGCAFALILSVSQAHANDRVYWGNFDGDVISYTNIDGSGSADLPTPGAVQDGPQGFSINPAMDTLYWANYGPIGSGNSLGFARLDGSGGGTVPIQAGLVGGPHGTAIDPGANRIYWTNEQDNTIRFANLDGSADGILPTTPATVNGPRGLALDLAGGRIYWANHDGSQISYANLDGSGGGDISTVGATVDHPEGVALYNGRIYWGNFAGPPSVISYANLDGSGGADLSTPGATVSQPHGVAIDPSTQRIYWANYGTPEGISWAKLDGSGGQDIPINNATLNGPALPMLLEQPAAEKTPMVHGTAKPGSKLTCTRATWEPNVIVSQLYQSPQSVSHKWLENGHPLKGEDGNSLTVHDVAEYSCLDSATNAAGTTAKASDAIGVFKLGRLHRNRHRGTAKLTVKVPGPGRLSLQGKKVVKKRVGVAGASSALARKVKGGHVKLLIKAKGKAKRHLDRTGKVKVKVLVGYRPPDGGKGTQTKVLRLQER